MELIMLAMFVFTSILSFLALLITGAQAIFVGSQHVSVILSPTTSLSVTRGTKLLAALTDHGIYLASACGGAGICGLCKVRVVSGGGPLLPTEYPHLSRGEQKTGLRLACQLRCKEDIRLELPPEHVAARGWTCRIQSTRPLTPNIKEISLGLPEGETIGFRAGAFVQVLVPPFELPHSDGKGLVKSSQPLQRAYSIANPPIEAGRILLNVRLALPPRNSQGLPPGLVSSYLFSLKEGDSIEITGPFGDFYVRDSDRELVFVGGGVGIAPLRSMLLDQLFRVHTPRKISFWYGARSRRELFYSEDFDRMQKDHLNFRWSVALSEPEDRDLWTGARGYIHEVLHDSYLKDHASPEELEYYLCGPPPMIRAVIDMLLDLGVPREQIFFDSFAA